MSANQPVIDTLSQAPTTTNVVDLASWRVRLRGAAGQQDLECDVREVNATGLVVDTIRPLGRFTWLEVNLPDGTGVSALGEVLPRRDPVELAVEVRFKHLFPDHRARLLSALALRA